MMISSALPINVLGYYFGMSEKTEKWGGLICLKIIPMQFPFKYSEVFLI